MSEGTDGLEEEQIPILFVEMCYYYVQYDRTIVCDDTAV